MKAYLKILSISAATQLIGFILTYVADFILLESNQSTIAPIFVGLAFVMLSMILAFFLAIQWCETKRTAFITFVLLPTNYTWLILVGLVVRFVEDIIIILDNISPNFG